MNLLAQAIETIRSLPLAAYLLAATGVATGVTFWLSGRRLLRPCFALLGGLSGGAAGFFLGPSVADSLFGVPTPYVGLGTGAFLGLLLGMALFRFAVAITTGLALALAGGLMAATYLHFAPKPGGTGAYVTPSPSEAPAPETLAPPTDRVAALVESAKPIAAEVRAYVAQKADEVLAAWQERSPRDQTVLGVSGLGAGIGGFMLGLLAPRRSAAVATALFGAALWMGCAAWLARALGAPGSGYLNQDAAVWLPAWLVLSVVGFAVQLSGMGKPAKPAPAKE